MDSQKAVATPFNGTSTSDEVIDGIDLRGKLAVITGGSVGLGKETARALAKAGAELFLGARSKDALADTQRDLEASGAVVHVAPLDLSDPASVDAFADAVLALERPVDLLINNAGIMACPQERDVRGNDVQLATNFLGHALLTSRLAPALRTAGNARLVSLSSVAHQFGRVDLADPNFERREYDPWVAYGQSKTANVLLARKVASDLASAGVKALAVHPGMIDTDLGKYITPEIRDKTAKKMKDHMHNMRPRKSVEAGAATSVWAATSTLLEDRDFAYLEDCSVAPLNGDSPNYGFGVMPYAIDAKLADDAWALAEKLLSRPLPLSA